MTQGARVAIVTGAGSGIGRASALALLQDGYRVVFAGRRAAPLESVVADAGERGCNALAVPTPSGRSYVGSSSWKTPTPKAHCLLVPLPFSRTMLRLSSTPG